MPKEALKLMDPIEQIRRREAEFRKKLGPQLEEWYMLRRLLNLRADFKHGWWLIHELNLRPLEIEKEVARRKREVEAALKEMNSDPERDCGYQWEHWAGNA